MARGEKRHYQVTNMTEEILARFLALSQTRDDFEAVELVAREFEVSPEVVVLAVCMEVV